MTTKQQLITMDKTIDDEDKIGGYDNQAAMAFFDKYKNGGDGTNDPTKYVVTTLGSGMPSAVSLLTPDDCATIQQQMVEDAILRREPPSLIVAVKEMNELWGQWEGIDVQFNTAVLPCFRLLRGGVAQYTTRWSQARSDGLRRLTESAFHVCGSCLWFMFVVHVCGHVVFMFVVHVCVHVCGHVCGHVCVHVCVHVCGHVVFMFVVHVVLSY
jgi:hypothetical protein